MWRRLHRIDRAILLVLGPLWLVCFALSVWSVVRPAGSTSVRVSAWQDADEYPEILYPAPFIPVERISGLRVGDRVLRLGETDLRGASGLRFIATYRMTAWREGHVRVEAERNGKRFETRMPPMLMSIGTPMVLISPIVMLFGIAILLKAPRASVARATFHLFVATALTFSAYFSGPGWAPWLSLAVYFGAGVAVGPLMIRLIQLFPHGVPPRSPWQRALPYPFALLGLSMSAVVLGIPYADWYAEPIASATQGGVLVTALALVQGIYRRSDPVGKRQFKWSLLGFYVALLPAAVATLWTAFHPEQWRTMMWSVVFLGLAPPFIYMALYRYDLFDVDRLVSATAAYNTVLVVLAVLALFVVPRVGEAASAGLGLPSSAGQIGAAVGLALLVVPVQRRLRPRVEALLFRERHALERGLEALAGELSGVADAKALLHRLGEQLHECVKPESTVLYGRDGERYAALFVEGRGAAAEIPADGPLVATLRQQRGPVCADGELAGAGARTTDPFARAALEVLNAAVVLPIAGPDGTPVTLVCLGPKRSGDLYTSAELHLLRSVADRAALELARFDQESFARESRAMQDAMRRYVPGAIADHIERGDALEAGERQVSVLFVDIRGYTALSEGSAAHAIFSTINRYTQAVSEIVQAEGGTVVEFNGDGMMAVFGAPAPLPEKERAAVRAARRIAEEVEGLEHEGRPVSVGIGVASGSDYVGNIQAADRMIWSAIGNTTNLAARLQVLTRELDAAVVIDAATCEALGDDGRRFRRHEQIAIRGRSDRIDVFSLRGRRGGARPAPAPGAERAETSEPELIRRGAVWSACFAGRRVDLPDAKGLHYLARLLAAPGQEFHVLDLVAEVEGAAADPSSGATAAAEGLVSARSGSSSGDEVLDETARAEYRARLAELRQELDEAEAANDLGRSQRLREEMAFLEQELSSATGLGGRARRAASDEERARKAVYNRIRHVVKRLEAIHPGLAAHLDASVRTGTTCAYRPERPAAWRLG